MQKKQKDPSTDIRFRCMSPERMVNNKSDDLSSKDFICNKNDTFIPWSQSNNDIVRYGQFFVNKLNEHI